jgi:hypothetical protein
MLAKTLCSGLLTLLFASPAGAIPVTWLVEGTLALGDCVTQGAYCSEGVVAEPLGALGIDVGAPFVATVSFESGATLVPDDTFGFAFDGADVRISFAAGALSYAPLDDPGLAIAGFPEDAFFIALSSGLQAEVTGGVLLTSAGLELLLPYDGSAPAGLPVDPPGSGLDFRISGVLDGAGLPARFVIPTEITSVRPVPEPSVLATLACVAVAEVLRRSRRPRSASRRCGARAVLDPAEQA